MKDGNAITLKEPIHLIHRTKSDTLTMDQIDPTAIRMTKQGKRNSPAVGFYAYDSAGESEETRRELDARYGSRKLEYTLPVGSKVLDLTGAGRGITSRVSPEKAREYIDAGFSAIKGYDYVGPPEYVVLKLVLKGETSDFVESPKNEGLRLLRRLIKETLAGS